MVDLRSRDKPPPAETGRLKGILLLLLLIASAAVILSLYSISNISDSNTTPSLSLLFTITLFVVSVFLSLYLIQRLKSSNSVEGQHPLLHHLHHPKHCFCKHTFEELEFWFRKRYVDKIPTVQLLEEAGSNEDREAISAIALLDLDEKTMLSLMGDVNMPHHHIIHCRAMFLERLNNSAK